MSTGESSILYPNPVPRTSMGRGEGSSQQVWCWSRFGLRAEPGQHSVPMHSVLHPPLGRGASPDVMVSSSLALARPGLSGYPGLYRHGACAPSATAGTCP